MHFLLGFKEGVAEVGVLVNQKCIFQSTSDVSAHQTLCWYIRSGIF